MNGAAREIDTVRNMTIDNMRATVTVCPPGAIPPPLTFAVVKAAVEHLRRAHERAHRPDATIIRARHAEPGRIYKFWSESVGRVCKGEFLTWGRGAYREVVFFRGEPIYPRDKRPDEVPTVVVGVHADDNVKKVPPKELGDW